MHQIYITAILTTILSLLVWSGFILHKTSKREKKLIIIFLLLQLPISFILLNFVRAPWTDFLVEHLGKKSPYILIEKLFEAPILEELGKLWPLIIPFFWKKVTKENALKLGLAFGIGFGIGEIWAIAHMTAGVAAYANYHWYEFIGFVSERFITAFLHGAMTGLGLSLIKNRSKIWVLLPIFLHFLLNSPIFLKILDVGGLIARNAKAGQTFWAIVLSTWIILFAAVMLAVLYAKKFLKGENRLATLVFGKGQVCQCCKKRYERPAWVLNFLFFQYKKCPRCGVWSRSS